MARMTNDDQMLMRREIEAIALRYMSDNPMNAVECFSAIMGSAAVVAGVLPLASRMHLIETWQNRLIEHANKRAEELRSGAFDRQQSGH